ncbi:MAG TPA: DUF4292 domain-containing protein [Bacteroidales bacterium]|jgi:hypothetical protein|nr:DUF4292 domain-containing protein [Bacteroidales bacterium]MDD4086033.1 DUF4292 domain-containing protein [Bacteroidales bacterium]MDY0085005.1 DUF4292 domain-containing protein [Bacteroidales bacterium]HPE43325.1 DUF4292 domain-containing protein [Bacteroidales bacterium]
MIKKPLKEKGESFLLEKMAASELNFDWFSARCAVSVISDKKTKTDFRGQLRIQKDSVIWMSLSPALGIEVARLMITQDSIWFINRIEKNYFKGDYDFINSFFQTTIDFDILQALLLGNDMTHYEDDNFRAGIDAMDYRLSATQRSKKKKMLQEEEVPNILVQNIWLNPDHYKITKVNLKEFGEENKQLEVKYSRFGAVQDQLVPGLLEMLLQADRKLQIKLQYNNISTDEALKFPFSIPSKYTKMP